MGGRRTEEWDVAQPCLHLDLSKTPLKKELHEPSPPAAKTFLVVLTLPLYLLAFFFFNPAIARGVLNQQGVPLSNSCTNTDKVACVRSKRTFMTEMGSKPSYQRFKPVL